MIGNNNGLKVLFGDGAKGKLGQNILVDHGWPDS